MTNRDNTICYRVRNEDDTVVVDVHWEPTVLEIGDDSPVGLRKYHVLNMIRDLIDILEAMGDV